jgi:hypothetical protein
MHPDEYLSVDGLMDDDNCQLDIDNWLAQKQSSYEDRTIKVLLNRFELGDQIPRFKREIKEEFGLDHFTCHWFNNTFYDFPVHIGASSTVFSNTLALSDLYKRLTSTKMYEKFEEIEEEMKGSDLAHKACALIFPWAHMGNMIFHSNSNIFPEYGTRVVRNFAMRSSVYLDILSPFLDEIAKSWRPT